MKLLKNLLEDTSIVFAFVNSKVPSPEHDSIVQVVKGLSESKNIQAKIFIPENDKFSSREWYEKMFSGVQFEETTLKSTKDILESIEPFHNRIIVVDNQSKAPLFESREFIGVSTKSPNLPKMFKDFKSLYESYLSDSDSRKLFSLVYPPKKYSEIYSEINEAREKYFSGESFKTGSIVEDCFGLYEILDRCNNYAVVTDCNGSVSKKFIKDIQESEKELEFAPSFFKGYVPSDKFFENTEIVESFTKTIEDYKTGLVDDPYAILKSLKSIDSLLNGLDENIGNIQYSLTKINQINNHKYLEEMVMASSTSQMQAAKIIAGAVGSSDKGTPVEIINNAIRFVNKSNNRNQKEIFKRMLGASDKLNIKYDKSLLENSDNLYNEIHRDHKNLKTKSTDEVLKDHQDLRKIGVDYAARDVGGKREMIKDILSHKHGSNNLKSYKALKSDIRKAMDEDTEEINELKNETLKSYQRKAMLDTLSGKKNRNKGLTQSTLRLAGVNKPILADVNKPILTKEATGYGSARAGEMSWHDNIASQSNKLTSSRGHKLVDKNTKRVVSTHKTLSDAIQARKKLRGNSDTHSIEAINEVHLDPDYAEEIDILGYQDLKKKLALATGIANYGDQEPGEPITLVDLNGTSIKDVGHNKPGHSHSNSSDTVRKMKIKRHWDE